MYRFDVSAWNDPPSLEIIDNAKIVIVDDYPSDLSDNEKYLKVIDNARNRVNTLSEMPKECIMFYKIITIINMIKTQ